jgi:glucokinase
MSDIMNIDVDKGYAIGFDLGGTKLKAALVDLKGEVVERISLLTETTQGREVVLRQVIEIIKELIARAKTIQKTVLGIGIAAPGLVDSQKGVVHILLHIKDWQEVNLRDHVENEVNIPTYIENDVNSAALAEMIKGAGKGTRNLICLTLGTGVGGALIFNGELYRGSFFTAGEIGHIPVNINGPSCHCGGIACLERYVGSSYIIERTIEAIKQGRKTMIPALVNNNLDTVTTEIIALAAGKGDRLAKEIWEKTGEYIGTVLAGLINLLGPERIIIGGGVAQAGHILFKPIKRVVNERAMGIPSDKVKILAAELGEDAGIIGAAMLVMRNREVTKENHE